MTRKLVIVGLSLFLWMPLAAEPFFVPALLEGKSAVLSVQTGRLDLPWGSSDTLGFNGNYLGPTLRFDRGDFADISVQNTLKEDTTLHWHGLHVPAEFDGGPRQIITSGKSWNPRFEIRQPAATLWYHPHLMGKTAEHVYRGLAGLFIIEDDFSRSLNIPSEYGVNDFPVILQDRDIGRNGTFTYKPSHPDVMHGYRGNVLLVNGVHEPELNISGGTYRFRVLNGSNSSIFRVRFSDDRSFTVIAGDGGFLPESVSMNELIISSGERFEILVDIGEDEQVDLLTDVWGGDSYKAFSLRTDSAEGMFYDHPGKLRDFSIIDELKPDKRRTFNMETRGMRGFSINGKQMNMKRIDETVRLDTTELWTVRNVGRGMMNIPHSFHIHDVQFHIMSINGRKPPPHLSGPKDTVLLMRGDEVSLALRFRDYRGIYMYHCHFLEHEDAGMMGQFEVK